MPRLLLVFLAVIALAAGWPEIRISNGRAYDIQKSTNWVRVRGPVWTVGTNYVGISNLLSRVNKDGPRLDPQFIYHRILIFNFPERPLISERVSCVAMKIGVTNANGEPIELWDYGTPVTNRTARPKI